MNSLLPLLTVGLLILAQASACGDGGGEALDCDDVDAGHPDCGDLVEVAAVSGTALWLSDIHFDPFYPAHFYSPSDTAAVRALIASLRTDAGTGWRPGDEWAALFAADTNQSTAWSTPGEDANHKVFETVVATAADTLSAPDFILVTGDFLGHDYLRDYQAFAPSGAATAPAEYQSFVVETFRYVASTLRAHFPRSVPVFATVGNNDAFCGDYDIKADDPGSGPADGFLDEALDLWMADFLPPLNSVEEDSVRASFSRGGYYAVDLPGGTGNRMVVLNSVAFMNPWKYPTTSRESQPAAGRCSTLAPVDSVAQTQWLARQAAHDGRAWMAAHVPPGNDCFSSTAQVPSADWSPGNLSAWAAHLGPTSPFEATFAAHSHMASFKVVRDGGGTPLSAVLQGPSISPNHKNNPTFSVLRYDPANLAIEGLTVHWLDLGQTAPTWAAYPFAGVGGPLDASTLGALEASFETDQGAWDAFAASYRAQSSLADMGQLSRQNRVCLTVTP